MLTTGPAAGLNNELILNSKKTPRIAAFFLRASSKILINFAYPKNWRAHTPKNFKNPIGSPAFRRNLQKNIAQYKGKNIVANPLITREFGVLIEPQFLDYISAEENLRLLSQLTNQKQDTRIKELLEKTELYSSRKKKVKEFSFGMKQRLGLCQCLLTEVGFLILDEPFVGLDPIGKELFKQTILDMAHKQNVPVLFSSHDLDDVDEICDRVVMISKGNKQLDQPLEHKQTYTVKIECTISDDIKRSLMEKCGELSFFEDKIMFQDETLIIDIQKILLQKGHYICGFSVQKNNLKSLFGMEG